MIIPNLFKIFSSMMPFDFNHPLKDILNLKYFIIIIMFFYFLITPKL